MSPQQGHRRSIRLRDYDYAQSGVYFVTLCVAQKQCLFGDVVEDVVQLADIGKVVETTLLSLPEHFPQLTLDMWVVMPNHLHVIFILEDIQEGGSRTAPTVSRKPLGRLIGAFKTMSTKQINLQRNTSGEILWQRNYYEHIIRNEKSLEEIREYILNNPARWAEDDENTDRRLT